jgi:site-specific DNA recombinase
MKKEKQVRVVGYVRVSTEKQTEGVSIDQQRDRIIAYTRSQGWNLISIFEDSGYSGKNLNRPGISDLLTQTDSFDILLVYRVDRLTRRQKDLWQILENVLEPSDIGFKSVSEPFDTTTPSGKAFVGMIGVFAQLERDTISQRTKDGLSYKKANGQHCGRIPYGFQIDSGNGNLIKDDTQQNDIKLMKRLRRSGKSFQVIARRFDLTHKTVIKLINTNLKTLNSQYINS